MTAVERGCVDVIGVDGNCVDVVVVDIRVGGGGRWSSAQWSDKRWLDEIWITMKIPPMSSMFWVFTRFV